MCSHLHALLIQKDIGVRKMFEKQLAKLFLGLLDHFACAIHVALVWIASQSDE